MVKCGKFTNVNEGVDSVCKIYSMLLCEVQEGEREVGGQGDLGGFNLNT